MLKNILKKVVRRIRKKDEENVLTIEQYLAEFSGQTVESNKKIEHALKHALDIRKFEIDMYWKRATYFWTIIGAIFAGYFLLIKQDVLRTNPNLIFLLNCIGFLFSLSWFLVNRGSKFWQNNWERHVDLLEDKVTGPLYKTVIQNKKVKVWKINKEYGYSVSKINQLLSFIVTVIWFGMGLYFCLKQTINIDFYYTQALEKLHLGFLYKGVLNTWLLGFFTLIAALMLIFKGKSNIVKQDIEKEKLLIRKRTIE